MKNLSLVAFILLFVLTGCQTAAPIHRSPGVAVPQALQDEDQLELAAQVVRHPAVSARGWYVEELMDDRVRIRLDVRVHTVIVDVFAENNKLTPVLARSVNLDEAGGNIHPRVNSWLLNLENDMRRALSDLGASARRR